MRDKDTITIYWSPASFITGQISWNMVYSKPNAVLTDLHRSKVPGSLMTQCPAAKETLANVFSFNSAVDDEFDIPEEIFNYEPTGESIEDIRMNVDSVVGMFHERPTSIKEYTDVIYNLGWLFFADEPVKARMTAPWFPVHTPMEGAYLAPGEFDIGRWYRSYNLDYHIPKKPNKFSIKAGDPLFFMEVMTDKKVVFKRYLLDEKLISITKEATASPLRYGRHKTLEERYQQADDTSHKEMVLSLIKKNLIDEDEPRCPIDHSRQND
jgi:hypothetical protein